MDSRQYHGRNRIKEKAYVLVNFGVSHGTTIYNDVYSIWAFTEAIQYEYIMTYNIFQ